MFFKPLKVLKKHWVLHVLWFFFVPFLSSMSFLINILNGNQSQIVNDLSLGYFYTVSLAITCSFLYDFFVGIYESKSEKIKDDFILYKVGTAIFLTILIIVLFILQVTLFGKLTWIQIVVFAMVCFASFYWRLVSKMDVYLDENCEYLNKEKEDIKRIDDSSQNPSSPKTPDGGDLKLWRKFI